MWLDPHKVYLPTVASWASSYQLYKRAKHVSCSLGLLTFHTLFIGFLTKLDTVTVSAYLLAELHANMEWNEIDAMHRIENVNNVGIGRCWWRWRQMWIYYFNDGLILWHVSIKFFWGGWVVGWTSWEGLLGRKETCSWTIEIFLPEK